MPRGNNIITTVDKLINPIDSTWDVRLVSSIFWDVDVNRILQIPITSGRDDVVAWHYNRNGIFSVNSAYHGEWKRRFGQHMNDQRGGVSSTTVWKQLWKLDVPAKIKILGGELSTA